MLILNENRIVPISALQRELWGDEPPRSALTTLQTYILHLRKLLGRAYQDSDRDAKDILLTKPTGYLLKLEPGVRDLDTYRELVRDGETALRAGDDARASKLLGAAILLWQGTPLIDVHLGPLLDVEVRRLEEAHISSLEQRIEADLRLGHHQRVLGELVALKAEHQFNENLHAQYMLALYRSGRRTQALTTYLELRKVLIDDLGLDPSPQLRKLHQAILSCDPALEYDSSNARSGGLAALTG